MDTTIGAKERVTQNRLIGLFRRVLKYTYLGNWEKRESNSNVEEEYLTAYLARRGYTDKEIRSAIAKFKQAAGSLGGGLYNANKEVYTLLRYGVNVQAEVTEKKKMVHLIDWANPMENDFQIAEEVTIHGASDRRPDLVVYVNGIALAVIELKRSTVSAHEGIRQNIRNQQDGYIPRFFTTIQLLFAGNDTEGLHYGVIKTPEKFWLRWKEPCGEPCAKPHFTTEEYPNELDRSVLQFFEPARLLEYIHDFIIFDGGVKKAARPNQYFAIKAAQPRVRNKQNGIIWHSQGSGKSLTMIWLAQWIRENVEDARVVIITDRDELDKQIENGFKDAGEQIKRATSGDKLIGMLNAAEPWLICSLIHKFGNKNDGDAISVGGKKATKSLDLYLEELAKSLPADFRAKGNIYVFIDECHRTQGGMLHEAMKHIMGNDVMLIGFTGTPLLHTDKKKSIETFGSYIHSYKFNEAVEDGVILDLRYEARNVEQYLGKSEKIDEWFEAKTKGLSSVARAALKERWAKMEKLFSSEDRIKRIVADICQDMSTKRALSGGYGNAMLVADSIYQACRYWEVFQTTELKGHCAVVTSYDASTASVKDEYQGDGETEDLTKYEIYQKMIGNQTAEQFEAWAKQEFIDHPGDMKLLIVVDKLLTGFDAPRTQVLYIDKELKDHSLLQAIARTNRLFEGKDFGLIVDYRGLINKLDSAMEVYSGAGLEAFDSADIQGVIVDVMACVSRLREAYSHLCDLFVSIKNKEDTEEIEVFLADIDIRAKFYDELCSFGRALSMVLNSEKAYAAFTKQEIGMYQSAFIFYSKVRRSVKKRYADTIDNKEYEKQMQNLLDTHMSVAGIKQITNPVDILDRDELEKELHELGTMRSKADAIVSHMTKSIKANRDENPAYYDTFSKRIKEALEDYKNRVITEAEYLSKMKTIMEDYRKGTTNITYPEKIKGNVHAQAFYGVITAILDDVMDISANIDVISDISIRITEIVDEHNMVDWQTNKDIHNKIAQDIDDMFYEIEKEKGIQVDFDSIDKIIENVITVALRRFK